MPIKTPHKLHRRHVGPLTQAPFPAAVPQYQTGARHGQQLALIHRCTVVLPRLAEAS
jgi:hypothetical protein